MILHKIIHNNISWNVRERVFGNHSMAVVKTRLRR